MKGFILIFSIFLFFSCSTDDGPTTDAQDNSIIGTWELVESYGSSGGVEPQWRPVDEGYSYTFKSDGTFSVNRSSRHTIGCYSLSPEQLVLKYDCEGATGIENSEKTLHHDIEFDFENGVMILVPTYLTCIEGCGYKFQKIGEAE